MRPLLLKAHTRPITHIEFNKEGDLLWSTSKDNSPVLWRVENGERIGTYDGHTGSVWFCSVSANSRLLLTASADHTVKLWDARRGAELTTFPHPNPVRCVQFSAGDNFYVSATDQVFHKAPHILIYKLAADPHDNSSTPVMDILGPNPEMKINNVAWGPLNRTLYCCNEDATVRIYDTESGKQIGELRDHAKSVVQLQFDQHQLLFVTASKDGTAKLYDVRTNKLLKTYETGRPVNVATISPLKDHVLLGGGQDAGIVTTTSHDTKQFKAVLFDLIRENEIGRIAGHFGPIHTAQFTPDGKGYASGSEDGYVRLYMFDKSYLEEGRPKAAKTASTTTTTTASSESTSTTTTTTKTKTKAPKTSSKS
ncbi:Eukaryotic translation initiation factor 3 subunit I [Pelomyxa schiedti]|nr:Eukaryotic translation initiation factor 3 subunit I [Pelomyxa schiedti]